MPMTQWTRTADGKRLWMSGDYRATVWSPGSGWHWEFKVKERVLGEGHVKTAAIAEALVREAQETEVARLREALASLERE